MTLQIDQKYYNKLYIEGFSQMLKSPTCCYKFYWLEAIVQLILKKKTRVTYDEIINEMIVNAWYTVLEYHVHLSGVFGENQEPDSLERAIKILHGLCGLPNNASEEAIKEQIKIHDKALHDVLWNLMPMDPSLNSSKGAKLPKWKPFFARFANNQFLMYQMIQDERIPKIRTLYEDCYRDNLHSAWANQELYREGNSQVEFYNILEKNMRPVYDSARRQGYVLW